MDLQEAVALVRGIDPGKLDEPRLSLDDERGWRVRASLRTWGRLSGDLPPAEALEYAALDAFEQALFIAYETSAEPGGPIAARRGQDFKRGKLLLVDLREVVSFFASGGWPDIPAPLLALVAVADAPVTGQTTAAGQTAGGAAGMPPETAKQRRARLLELHDVEVAAGRKLGAVNRIAAAEKQTRPTADRSNIGKAIKKAREERADDRRGGEAARVLTGGR